MQLSQVIQYNTYFNARTRSLAHALAAGEHIPRNLLHKILATRNIPPDSLALWVDVLARRDPIYALGRLGLLESAGTEMPGPTGTNRGRPDCPDWLYLALPGLVTETAHVPYLASQILSDRFARLAEQVRAVFVARCLQHFLRVRHYVALRELVEWVAYVEPDDPTALSRPASFEAVLAALATGRVRPNRYEATPPHVLEPLVALVLAAYSRRHGDKLPFGMYRSLLSAKLIPRSSDAALRLLARMTRDGWTPSRAMLQQVMRVCAKEGRHAAAMQLLEQMQAQRGGSRLAAGETGLARQLEQVAEEPREEREAPLHLRGWSSADLDRELEGYEDGGDGRHAPAWIGGEADFETEDVRVRRAAHEVLPSVDTSGPDSDATATGGRPAPAGPVRRPVFAETLVLLDREQVMPYFRMLLTHAETEEPDISAFPLPPFAFDRIAWTQFFHTVSAQADVGADQLVAVLQSTARASLAPSTSTTYLPPVPSLRLYTVVLQALVRRDEPRAALHLWRFLEKRGHQPDDTLLDTVVRAHLALDHDRVAERLLEQYARGPTAPEPGASETVLADPLPRRLTAVPLNALLAHRVRHNRFHAAHDLYTTFRTRFGVEPDSATLSIMLDAARHASSRAGRGWTPAAAFEEAAAAGPVFGGSLGAHRSGGGAGAHAPVDDTWDGEPASKLMERFLLRDVLELNWQDARLETPWLARGVVGWLATRFGAREGPSSRTKSDTSSPFAPGRPDEWRPFASTLSPTPPTAPQLVPTDRVFRSLIRLVVTHSSITSIPTLLSWMRVTHVRPSRFSLCIALAYVDGEASFRAEQMERLVAWLAGWLGEGALPTQAEIAWMRRGGKREGQPVTRGR
ncbi:hypothetical protein JCM8202v2_005794 [Rhodotorula sphaerocarpa]